jgi:hypothetical protein
LQQVDVPVAKAPISAPNAADDELGESAPADDAARAASTAKPRRKPANATAEPAAHPA